MEISLDSILKWSLFPFETIIVDQSDTDETKTLCEQAKYKKLSIHYHHISTKSLTLARNFGIEKSSPTADYVLFLDDDVSLSSNFLDELKIFFQHHPHALWWVANIESPLRKISLIKKIWFILLTGGVKFAETFVTSGGFNVMPLKQITTLKTVEWTSGCGMFFRKKIFDEWFRFETRFMKYCLMEDCFFSYSVQHKYPKSLYFVPGVKMVHRETPASRIPNKARILQNIVHRFYFVQKFKKSIPAYVRTMLIFCIFDLINHKDLRIIPWYVKWLSYVFSNKNKLMKPDFDFNTFIFA